MARARSLSSYSVRRGSADALNCICIRSAELSVTVTVSGLSSPQSESRSARGERLSETLCSVCAVCSLLSLAVCGSRISIARAPPSDRWRRHPHERSAAGSWVALALYRYDIDCAGGASEPRFHWHWPGRSSGAQEREQQRLA